MKRIVAVVAVVAVVGLVVQLLVGANWSEQTAKDKFLYLPARQNLWVVDREKGAIVFFKFPDTEERPIQRSKTYFVDQERFPPNHTEFILSTRSLSSILWISNTKTGEVQVLRYRRDGTFASEFQLQAARHFEYK